MSIRKIKNKIAKKLKFLRLEKGLSQEQLSEYTHISREHISCIERAKNLATIDTLYAFAKYFGIDVKDFL